MQQYDPMLDFWKRANEFIFKQAPAVALSFVFCAVMAATLQILWGRMERMEAAFEAKLETRNKEWSKALDIARADWRECESRREQLAVKVAALETAINMLKGKKGK